MDQAEFIDKLSDYYTTPSNIEIEVLDRYISDKEINFNSLFNNIVEHYTYKSFPKLAVIKKFLVESQGENNQSGDFDVRNLMNKRINEWFELSTQDIIDMLINMEPVTDINKLFIATFGELRHEYYFGKDMNMPDSELWPHLHFVKGCLKNNDYFSPLHRRFEQVKVTVGYSNKQQHFKDIKPIDWIHD